MLYLAIERGREVPRAVLQELLFPRAKVGNGAHSLRQLLYQLRKWGLDVGTDPRHACLGPADVGDPVAAVVAAQRVEDDQLRAIAGGYLPAYLPSVSEPFREWLDAHRSAVNAMLLRALSGQLAAAKDAHDWPRTERIARACLGLDALNEEATLVLAENLALTGAKSEAVGMLDKLMVDLGTSATPLKLPATVLRRRISERVPDAYGKQESPLVDRDHELRAIGGFLDANDRGGAVMLMLTGDPGIGKTRLMERTERMAGIGGIATVRVAVHPHYVRRPLSLFSDAIPQLVRMPGALGCSPESLQYLRVLQQGTTDHLDPAMREADAEAQFARVLRAIDDILDAITSESRLLLIVEDAHDLDALSARVLTTIAAKRGSRRLMVAATLRPGSDAGETMRRNERSMVIPLGPLSSTGSAELIKQLLVVHRAIADSALTDWWGSVAGGNPLFLTMLVVHHARTGARFAIPHNLHELLLKRLEGLKDSSVLLFEACAVLGENATVPHIEYCTGLPIHELHAAMRELEGCGLIAVSGQSVQPVHRLLTDAALSATPSTVRMLLHRRAAEALEGGKALPAARWSAAEHWASTGDEEREAASLQSCAEQLLAIGRPSEACDLFDQAASQCEGTASAHSLLMSALTAAEAAGRWGTVGELLARMHLGQELPRPGDEAGAHFFLLAKEAGTYSGADLSPNSEALFTLSANAGLSPSSRLRACRLLVTIADLMWAPDLGRSAWTISASLRPCDPADLERQLNVAMIYHVAFGDQAEGQSCARQLIALTIPHAQRAHTYQTARNAVLALHRTGATTEALNVSESCERELRESRLFASAYGAAAQRAEILLDLGDFAQARLVQQSADQLAIESVDRDFSSGSVSNRIRIALDEGNLIAAESLLSSLSNVAACLVGRHKWIAEVYRLWLSRLRGHVNLPVLNSLLGAHLIGRGFSGHDEIVAELFYSLRAVGEHDQAKVLLTEYITAHRRDRYPLPSELKVQL